MEGIGGVEITFLLFFLLLSVGGTIFWVWMLVECITKEPRDSNDRIVWAVVIAITHLLGAGLYFLLRRPKRMQTVGA